MISKLVVVGIASIASVLGASAFALLRPAPPQVANDSAPAVQFAPAGMLPARLLDCDLGRIINFDPSHEQKPEDYRFAENHKFRLYLPSIPVRTTEPPSSTQPPEPVDPRTRILADPDAISRGAFGRPFYRVVDYWPERVEMTTPIATETSNLVILDRYDASTGVVHIFMTAANDAVTFDQKRLYAGNCHVATGGDADAAAGR